MIRALTLVFVAVFAVPQVVGTEPAATSFQGLKVVFTGLSRAYGAPAGQMIYTVDFSNPDNPNPDARRLTDPDTFTYNWASWAVGGTKIVYSAKNLNKPETGEDIYLMDADGSHRVQLTSNGDLDVQPKVSPDGKSVLFTARRPEFPDVALYLLDLTTGDIRNLSSRHHEDGARDSDPRWSADGSKIVFANTRGADGPEQPTQIYLMNADGSERKRLTQDNWWNTDPSLSPDGTRVAISSYRGAGKPRPDDSKEEFAVKVFDWHLTVLDLATGTERVLTEGRRCLARNPYAPLAWNLRPCTPTEGPAWVPQWSPDGTMIGYISMRSVLQAGIYVIDADGSNARPMVEIPDVGISWWDWTSARPAKPVPAFAYLSRPDTSSFLYGARKTPGDPIGIFTSTPDRWMDHPVSLADTTPTPTFARWTADKKHIVFTARAPFDQRPRRFEPAPPPGKTRSVHYTLNDYTFVELPRRPVDRAQDQIYLMDADGTNVRRLTTPWTEDWLEAMPNEDTRGNTDPDVSPDGRYVVFTNTSTTTPESYILRLDLVTGEVVNLSAISNGAMAVADSNPRYSPDGATIAFSSVIGEHLQIFVMNADGTGVRQITNDDYHDFDPAWSPDAAVLVFSSYRGSAIVADPEDPSSPVDLKNWHLVKADVRTGETQVLTGVDDSPVFRPVFSPDGSRIAYIASGKTKQQIDIAVMNADGSDAHPIVTLLTKEEFVDWR